MTLSKIEETDPHCWASSSPRRSAPSSPRRTVPGSKDISKDGWSADLFAAGTPLEPEQAAARLGVCRAEFDWTVRLGWVRSPRSIEVGFGTSRAGAVDVALYITASVDAVIPAHLVVDWE
ncbi:hypothetical protein ACF068_07375 [Streptomyces sp. NPDC016309]|uniref:hypothetical protein n=1 Tax=Streptomyces sp. NPDC016309 TaxID=3364965 RepID=UPI0036F5FD62